GAIYVSPLFHRHPATGSLRQGVVERRSRDEDDISAVALRDDAPAIADAAEQDIWFVEVRRDRGEQRGLEHVAVAEGIEPIPNIVGAAADGHARGNKLADERHA